MRRPADPHQEQAPADHQCRRLAPHPVFRGQPQVVGPELHRVRAAGRSPPTAARTPASKRSDRARLVLEEEHGAVPAARVRRHLGEGGRAEDADLLVAVVAPDRERAHDFEVDGRPIGEPEALVEGLELLLGEQAEPDPVPDADVGRIGQALGNRDLTDGVIGGQAPLLHQGLEQPVGPRRTGDHGQEVDRREVQAPPDHAPHAPDRLHLGERDHLFEESGVHEADEGGVGLAGALRPAGHRRSRTDGPPPPTP